MPGAQALTAALAARNVPIAVATSSTRPLFDLKTRRHRAWFATFSAIVTGDDPRIGLGKPAPDIFLVAAKALGAAPSACVVVEDAPAGVEAAHAAGMQVVAVPDPGMDRSRFGGAELLVTSLLEVGADNLIE
jgi:pseudouridine-5'-monophosphatase